MDGRARPWYWMSASEQQRLSRKENIYPSQNMQFIPARKSSGRFDGRARLAISPICGLKVRSRATASASVSPETRVDGAEARPFAPVSAARSLKETHVCRVSVLKEMTYALQLTSPRLTNCLMPGNSCTG
jgi:hypothetical protein